MPAESVVILPATGLDLGGLSQNEGERMRGVDVGRRGVLRCRSGRAALIVALLSLFGPMTAASAAPSAEQDFAARCQGATRTTSGSGGVLRCFSFDTSADLPRANPGNNESWGQDFGIMANNQNPNVPVIDTTTKASGGGSMRFNQPAGGGSSSAGSWFTHFGPNKTGQLANGEGPIWVQYRVRWSPELLVNSMWPGSGGAKVMDISLGDTPACIRASPAARIARPRVHRRASSSCFRTMGSMGCLSVYANCNGTAAFNAMAGGSGLNPEVPEHAPLRLSELPVAAVQTVRGESVDDVQDQVGPVQWNAWASAVQVWFGYEGEALTLIIDCEAVQPNKCTSGFPASNGWWFQNSNPAVYKMGKVYLHPYQTCQTSPCNWGSSTATAWYDELIISTQDIADPGVGAPVSPSAPCCLSVTQLTPVSLVLLGAIVLSRRQWYRLRRGRHVLARIQRTVRGSAMPRVLIAMTIPLLAPVVATASPLSNAAASMPAGTFVELTGMTGFGANGSVMQGNASGCTTGDHITQYANKAVWNPILRQFMFVGYPHGGVGCGNSGANAGNFVIYDDASNTWSKPTGPGTGGWHSYDQNTLDPATGTMYHIMYNGTGVWRRTSGGSWSQFSSVPKGNSQCCTALAVFPDRNSIIHWDGDWGLWEFNIATGVWNQRARGVGNDGSGFPQFSGASYNVFAHYSARCQCVIFGGGAVFVKYNSNGTFTTLTRSGAPSSGDLIIGPDGSSFVTEPVTGNLLVISPGVMRVFDPGTTTGSAGSWAPAGATLPSFFSNGPTPSESLISAPVSTYGIVMYVKCDDASQCRVFLYKHTPSGPQTIPGTPANLIAN